MNEVDLSEYHHLIDCLGKWLAKYLHVHRGQILLTALETKPFVVTYRMDLQNSEKILNFLRTDIGLTEASRNKVDTVVEIQSVIRIGIQSTFIKFIKCLSTIQKIYTAVTF